MTITEIIEVQNKLTAEQTMNYLDALVKICKNKSTINATVEERVQAMKNVDINIKKLLTI